MKIFAGSSHPQLTQKICSILGVPIAKSQSFAFSNDNRFVTIDEPVRGEDVFFIQTSCQPTDAHLMETLMFIRSLRDASAGRVIAVTPYFPYVRSDKRNQPRICITARLVADLIQEAGASHILIMDMHSSQLQGFFSIPCDHLLAAPTFINHLKTNWDLQNYILVAADAGAAKILKAYADALHLPVAIMDKRRDANDEQPKIKGVIGDVKGKKVLIIDDEVASGRTLIRDAEFLINHAGVLAVDACATHAVLGPGATESINNSPINRLLITDTIPTDQQPLKNKELVSVAPVFAECIKRIHLGESIMNINET